MKSIVAAITFALTIGIVQAGGGLFDLTTAGDFQLIGVADWGLGANRGPTSFGAYTPVDRVSEFVTSWSGYKK